MEHWLQLRFRVEGAARVIVPPFTGRRRADELWRTTCFELFVRRVGQGGYSELNLSPSESWAAYDFTARREGMSERAMSHDPVITPRTGGNLLILDAALPLADLPALPIEYGPTCVIEEEGGIISYWAVRHGNPDAPDFHDPACFAGTLAPPNAA